MRINPIFNINLKQKINNIKNSTQNPKNALSTPPSTLDAYNSNIFKNLYFFGGYSLDLKQTIENLDEDTPYIEGIRQQALTEIAKGNPDKKTLIDIHMDRYKYLEGCYSLEEAKRIYPEFENVISDKNLRYYNGSFIDKVKKGEMEFFNPDEDLALQILKFYWGKGLSLTSLKDKTGNINITSTIERLNIPLVSRHYGMVLKLSDADYNKRLMEEVAKKRRETLDRKEQKENGLPVYIPKGPLSQEHKDHISQGLLAYYAQKRLLEGEGGATEAEKRYFTLNPEQKERMAKAMRYAWKTPQGRGVQKNMIKFFKKNHTKMVEIEEDIFKEQTLEQRELLKLFWARNTWAAKEMSVAVKSGWKKLKEEEAKAELDAGKTEQIEESIEPNQANKTTLRLLPKPVFDQVEKELTQLGKLDDYIMCIDYSKSVNDIAKEGSKIDCYQYVAMESAELKTLTFLVAVHMVDRFSRQVVPNKKITADKKFMKEVTAFLEIALRDSLGDGNVFDDLKLLNFLKRLGRYAYDNNHPEMLEYMEETIDKAYELLLKKDDSDKDFQNFQRFKGRYIE